MFIYKIRFKFRKLNVYFDKIRFKFRKLNVYFDNIRFKFRKFIVLMKSSTLCTYLDPWTR